MDAEIVCERIGCCGVITLNRPRALNALSFDMVAAMGRALETFAHAPDIRCVVLRSANTAFCAGADIKAIAQLGMAGRHAEQLAFLAAEYRNCHRIAQYPKPYIALIDGIIMGGGAGIAVNGAHRVAGDNVSFAMPEVGIGFFPDIGASFFLPRLPAQIGTYLAVTGARAALGDVVALGLATAHVPSARFAALFERLIGGEAPQHAIAAERAVAPDSDLVRRRDLIARCFAAPSLHAVLAALGAESAASPFAAATLKLMHGRSPTSMAIALKQMRLGAALSFDAALRMEFRVAARIVRGHDFYEGVRAALIDKDHTPLWRPASVDAVAAADIDAYFAPGADELAFSAPAGAA